MTQRPTTTRPLVAVLVVAVTSALLAAAAGAQTGSSPPTTVAPTPTSNPAGTVVFLGVCAVIVVGALVLYLRNRRPRGTGADPAEAPR